MTVIDFGAVMTVTMISIITSARPQRFFVSACGIGVTIMGCTCTFVNIYAIVLSINDCITQLFFISFTTDTLIRARSINAMLVAMSCAQIIEGGALVNVITSKSITFIRVYLVPLGLFIVRP